MGFGGLRNNHNNYSESVTLNTNAPIISMKNLLLFSMPPMGHMVPNGPMPPMPMQMMPSTMSRMPPNMPVKPLFPAAGQV